MANDNSRLVFQIGNQWVKEKDSAPFFGLPSWWRRFMFQVLSPREITVYLYLCSVMDPNAVAYPTVEQIAEDMGVKSRSVVAEGLAKLVELGFLLRRDDPYNGRVMGKRVVYQRPLPHYTVLHLLRTGLIDENLYPLAHKDRDLELTSASDEVVRAGLRRLLGDDNFRAFESLKTPERKYRALVAGLEAHIEQAMAAGRTEVAMTIAVSDIMKNLSPAMREIVEEEAAEGVPF